MTTKATGQDIVFRNKSEKYNAAYGRKVTGIFLPKAKPSKAS
jgi:hypothetical protein